jgi:hypothetical protein
LLGWLFFFETIDITIFNAAKTVVIANILYLVKQGVIHHEVHEGHERKMGLPSFAKASEGLGDPASHEATP